MNKDNPTHLILGFTGGIGHAVALDLSKRNISVKAMIRDKAKAQKYINGLNNLMLISGDASNPGDLKKAFRGIDVVHYCINVPYPQWEKNALQLLKKCIYAAIEGKVKLIFPGNVYVYGHAKRNPVGEDHPHNPHTKKGRIRKEMEKLLHLAHVENGLDYTIVRMPDFYGPFVINTFSEQLYVKAIEGKSLQWIGDLDAEIELIFIEDGGEAMVMAAVSDKSNGQAFNIPGEKVTTARIYLSEIVKQAGRNSKIGTLNFKLVFILVGLFNPLVKELTEMLYLKREKLILKGEKFTEMIGPLPSTEYKTGIARTLNWAKKFYKL